MVDIYSPAVLNRVVQDLKGDVSTFLLDTFFPEISVSTQEEIFFDVLTGKPRLAPFVSPLVEGQIVQSLGYSTKSFKPAYVKDKRVLEDGKAFRRKAGDPIAQAVDQMAAREETVANETTDQIGMLTRRQEWMAAQVLLTGSVTITGEKYPTTVVNFGRDPSLTVTLTGTDLWSDAAGDPIEDLESFSGLVGAASGANGVDVVMAQNVYKAMRGKQAVKDLMDKGAGLSGRTNLDIGPDSTRGGATYKGTLGDFRIWVYGDSYVDENGATQKYVPDNYLILASADQIEGVRHYGAIRDEVAGFQALDYFSKSWLQPDPAARFLMLQSAPLVVPYRVNATLSAKVL